MTTAAYRIARSAMGDAADKVHENVGRSAASGVRTLNRGQVEVPDGVAHVHAVGHGDVRVDDHLDHVPPAFVRLREGEGALRPAGLVVLTGVRWASVSLAGVGLARVALARLCAAFHHHALNPAGIERDPPGGSLVRARERDPFPTA